jgi:hypothetical protein
VEFALILSRMINTAKQDPSQLRFRSTSLRAASCKTAFHVEIKERLMAGRNQNVMRLVLIELITAGHRIKPSPLCATVD